MFLRTIAVLMLGFTLVVAAGAGRSVTPSVAAQDAGGQSSFTIDTLFASYRSGDFTVLDRTLTRPRDFQTLMRRPDAHELDGWLREWHRGKSIFLLELASVAFRVAPTYAGAVIQAARAFLMSGSESDSVFASEWHRTAIGVLEGNGNPALIEEYADALKVTPIGKPPAGLVADRLTLARAVAQERRCWDARPTLEQPGIRLDEIAKAAGAKVPSDLDNPVPVSKAQLEAHKRCLQDAFARFEAAAAFSGVHAEAHVRGGWILFQQGRSKEALEWLDAAKPGED